MLIDWIVTHALIIFWIVFGLFIAIKLSVVLFTGGFEGMFWLFIGSFGIVSEHDLKNTFDERLKKYLVLSNKINTIFYWLCGSTLFIYLFTITLIR
jgi:hypothetical protein